MSDLAQEFEDDYPQDRDLIREVEERGATRERERIIALIERKRCSENEETHNCQWLNDYQADELIARIKGEDK